MNQRCYTVCRQLQLQDPTAKLTSDFPRELQHVNKTLHILITFKLVSFKIDFPTAE